MRNKKHAIDLAVKPAIINKSINPNCVYNVNITRFIRSRKLPMQGTLINDLTS
jgi:hypothetical protein